MESGKDSCQMLAGDKPSVDGAVSGICVSAPAEPVKAPALTLTLLFPYIAIPQKRLMFGKSLCRL